MLIIAKLSNITKSLYPQNANPRGAHGDNEKDLLDSIINAFNETQGLIALGTFTTIVALIPILMNIFMKAPKTKNKNRKL